MATEAVGGPASTSVLLGLGPRLRRLSLGVGSVLHLLLLLPPKQRGGGTGWVAIVRIMLLSGGSLRGGLACVVPLPLAGTFLFF